MITGSLSGEDIHLACDALIARINKNWGACEMFSFTENGQLRWISRKLREMSEGTDGQEAYRPGLVAAGVLRAIADRDASCRGGLTIPTIGLLNEVMDTLRRVADEPQLAPVNRHQRRAAAATRGTVH